MSDTVGLIFAGFVLAIGIGLLVRAIQVIRMARKEEEENVGYINQYDLTRRVKDDRSNGSV